MNYTDEYIVEKETLTAIADNIREKTGTTDTITVEQMPEKVNEVYEAGKQAEIINFANMIQKNGTRTDYRYCFYRSGLNDETFSDIFSNWNTTIQNANYMFQHTNIVDSAYTDSLDFSQCAALLSVFSDCSNLKKLKVIDARKTTSGYNGMANMFMNCKQLESIDEFYPSYGANKTGFGNTFTGCSALSHIIFKSEISQGGLDLKTSTKLDKESLTSVINCLSTTETDKSVTLSLTAVNNAFEGGRDGTEWQNLIATKPNWEIAYA